METLRCQANKAYIKAGVGRGAGYKKPYYYRNFRENCLAKKILIIQGDYGKIIDIVARKLCRFNIVIVQEDGPMLRGRFSTQKNNIALFLYSLILIILVSSQPTLAGTAILSPSKDNTLYEPYEDKSNGSGEYLFSGNTDSSNVIRLNSAG